MPLLLNWLTATAEPLPATVKATLQTDIAPIKTGVDGLVKAKPEDRPSLAVALLETLDSLLNDAKKTRQHADDRDLSKLAKSLKEFIGELRQWRLVALSLIDPDRRQNARTRFSDAGTWAMHYSTVRMTLGTFFITAGWGIVTLRWNEFGWEWFGSAVGAWILAGAFIVIFTMLMESKSKSQKKYQRELPVLEDSAGHTEISPKALRGIWSPVVIFGVMTLVFIVVLGIWKCHEQKLPVTRTALVEEDNAQNVKLSQWGAKIDAITTSLNEIKTKLTEPTPTITPTPTPTPKPTQGKGHGRRGHRHRHRV